GQHPVHHLRHGLALDRQAGGRRIGHAHAREQEAQVVVDLGDGADGEARVLGGRLLLDGDGRRQPVDVVDVGLLHHLQELARIGRQALDVAALAFRIDRVEGERGLARARQPREHDQRIARYLEVDVLEVVLARTPDVDGPVGLAGSDTPAGCGGRGLGNLAHRPGSNPNGGVQQTPVRPGLARMWTAHECPGFQLLVASGGVSCEGQPPLAHALPPTFRSSAGMALPKRSLNAAVSISSSSISRAITLAFHASCAAWRPWNSGITSRPNSSSDSQMCSWLFLPAWLSRITWSMCEVSNL